MSNLALRAAQRQRRMGPSLARGVEVTGEIDKWTSWLP
jgi:hypothetical protein